MSSTLRIALLLLVFAAFTAYTVSVMVGHGVVGFVLLAGREPWALQLLLDLLLMLALFAGWTLRDARARGLPAWPYAILVLVMGSMGALAYLVHRELAGRRRAPVTGR